MPNHVTSRLTAAPSTLALLIGNDEDGSACVDFNRIIPCPECVVRDMISTHLTTAAELALGLIDLEQRHSNPADTFKAGDYGAAASALHQSNAMRQFINGPKPKDFDDREFDIFLRLLAAWKETGYMDWYSWNIANWGTKWNAYSYDPANGSPADGQIRFETAWSAPHPVISKLFEQTDADILHEWADEDTGSNVGSVHYAPDSEPTILNLSGTAAGFELAFEFDPESRQYYKRKGDSYVYDEAADG